MATKKNPGLPSLNESRANRRRQITTGKTAIGGIPPRLFLGGLLVLVVAGFIYFRNSQAELEEQRGRVLAKQRAVAAALGPKLVPLRDRVEEGIAELRDAPADRHFVDPDVDWNELLGKPGLYLRLRLSEVESLEAARKAAADSLRDGFTSCFMTSRAGASATGEGCSASKDCEPGELCNEYGVCQRPNSPFNMRLLYRALAILSDQWTQEVQEAGTELALVAYERGLDSVTEVDIPVAIEVYQRAKYAVVVLDEMPKSGLPEPIGEEGSESEMERLQRVPHRARVGVWSLPEGKLLALVRGSASGELRQVGGQSAATSAEARAARARQANSCALALDVKAQLTKGRDSDGPAAGSGALDEPSGSVDD